MKRTIFNARRFAISLTGLLATTPAGSMASAADYYAGKTIELVIGADVGGGHDIYARLLARHLVRHIPGSPTIVPKNLPGAGSARAAGFIASVAPKDGTAIAAVFPGVVVGPLLDDRGQSQYDPTKLLYLATADSGTRICATFANSKTKTFEDALQQKTILGASAAGGSTRDYAALLKNTTGMKAEIVSGYKGTNDILLAMERGEVDGLCGFDWSSLKAQKPDWVRDKRLNLLVQLGLEPEPELTTLGVPEVWNFIKDEGTRKVVELVVSQQIFSRPYIAPPGTPDEQLKTLRAAFMATLKDKQLRDEAERLRIDISPFPGEKLQEIVERLYATPKAIVERAKEAIKP